MITVSNQFVLMFDIGNSKDFLLPDDMQSFLFTEAAGGELPAFALKFKTKDHAIRKKITQRDVFKISFGKTQRDMQVTSMLVYSTTVVSEGHNSWVISVSGTLDVSQFITTAKIKSFTGTGTSVIKTVASTYFSVDSDASDSAGSQVWLQPNITDRSFIQNIWKHSYIPGSFPLVAITATSDFIFRDIITLAGKSPKYDLSTDVVLSGGVVEDTDFGFINNWAGFGRTAKVHTIETGVDQTISESISTIVSMASDLEQPPAPGTNSLQSKLLSDNVHTNYQKAVLRNTMGLATFSGVKLTVSFSDSYLAIKPLDLVFYKEVDSGSLSSVDAVSGNYIVSRIGRSIADKRLHTTLELVREARNTQ